MCAGNRVGNQSNQRKKGQAKSSPTPCYHYGTPGRIRTYDLQLRRLTPYPLGYGRSGVRSQAASFGSELRFHFFKILDIGDYASGFKNAQALLRAKTYRL